MDGWGKVLARFACMAALIFLIGLLALWAKKEMKLQGIEIRRVDPTPRWEN